jgi:hypothetical protein
MVLEVLRTDAGYYTPTLAKLMELSGEARRCEE